MNEAERDARDLRAGERLLWQTSKAHRDAAARFALLRAWFAGESSNWRAAVQYLQPGTRVVPLAVPVSACPALVACRQRVSLEWVDRSPLAGFYRVVPRVRPRQERTERRQLLRERHWPVKYPGMLTGDLPAAAPHRGRAEYVCPAISLMQSWASCRAAVVSLWFLAPKLEVVGSGIDTLELHTKCPVGPHTGQQLEALFDEASATKTAQPVTLAGVALEIQPRMVKSGWLLKNTASDVVVRVRPLAEVDEASVTVELHAAALWALGWRAAGDLARKLCEVITGAPDVDLQVSRVDVCVDFQGWAPSPLDRELFVSRAKKRGRYSEGHVEPQWDDPAWLDAASKRAIDIGKQLARAQSLEERQRLLEVLHRPPEERVTCAEYEAGKLAFTGFAFGMGHHLGARLYNKSREIRRSRKGWFHEVWKRSGAYRMPPGGTVNGKVREHFDVWRLEFQLRREALREFTFNTEGGWLDLGAWEDCAEHVDELWKYLTLHWLRHGWRTAGSRVQLSAPWKVLHTTKLASGGQAVESLERHVPQVGVLPALGSLAGYATTAVAQACELVDASTGEEPLTASADFGATMVQVLLAATAHAEQRAPLADIVNEKRGKIRERRAFLAKRSTVREDTKRARAKEAQRYGTVEGQLFKRDAEHDRQEALSAVWRAEQARRAYEHARETLAF